jgi:hypothetical protein
MAKITYTKFVPEGEFFITPYKDLLFGIQEGKSGFRLRNEEPGREYIVVHGTDLHYKNGFLVSGTITDVEFKSGQYNNLMTAADMHFTITDKLDLSAVNAYQIYQMTLLGNDTVTGSKEGDVLYGGAGRNKITGFNGDDVLLGGEYDKMTGNLGSDTFVFFTGSKKLVVTDFDAVGGGTDQDYFYYEDTLTPRIYQDHHDTVIDFGHHQIIRLLGVHRGDVSMYDFKEPSIFSDTV